MFTITRKKVTAAAVALGLGLSGGALLAANGGRSSGATSGGPGVPEKGQEITIPGETHAYVGFLNGKVWKAKATVRRYKTMDGTGEIIEEDAVVSDEGPVPLRDPAFDGVKPTPAQQHEMNVAVGSNDDGTPMVPMK